MQYFYFKITTIPSLRMPDNWLHHFIPAMTSAGEHSAGLFSHRPVVRGDDIRFDDTLLHLSRHPVHDFSKVILWERSSE
jgi:hypothetical protein